MHDRKSLKIQRWDGNLLSAGIDIYAPRDEVHGGTWFGFLNKEDFKYAFLTNIRDPAHKETDKKSRGKIIPSFLNTNLAPRFFIQELKKMQPDYNLFNLIFGNKDECFYFHSKTGESKLLWNKSQKKEKIFGLSNGKLNSNWPKVQNTMNLFSKLKKMEINDYWNFFKKEMQNKNKYPLHNLPITGVSPEIEVFLSSLFIQNETYGTRSTLFFCFDPKKQKAHIFEQNYNSLGLETEESVIQI